MFRDTLKELRASHKLSQQRLADQLGLAQSSVNQYEHGMSEPDITTLKKLADIFDTSVDYLTGHTKCKSSVSKLLTYKLTPDEIRMLDKYREVGPATQCAIEKLIDAYLQDLAGK